MTKQTFFLILLGCLALTPRARAQMTAVDPLVDAQASEYVDPTDGLTLDAAIGRALDDEPSLRAARTEVDVAGGMRVQAVLRPNPVVSLSRQDEPGGMDSQTRVEVAWPLDLFRRRGRVAVAEGETEATQFAVADRERLLAADVRDAYGAAAIAIRELAVLDDLTTVVARLHEAAAARAEQGAGAPLDRDMLRVESRSLEAERLMRTAVVEQAMAGLRRLLGMSADEPLRIRDTLEQLVEREGGGALPIDPQRVAERPDVRAADARVRIADARIDRARREGRIDVTLSAMYMRMNSGFPQKAFGPDGGLEPVRGSFHNLGAGVMLMVPLSDRRQGEVAAEQAARAGAVADLEATALSASSELAAARARDGLARRATAIYTTDTLALARQNLAVVGRAHELGSVTVFEVLAEQRRYLDLQRAYTNALRDAYEARQALRRALGDVR
jgi:cobalt-zinc-cadmium efflux system outer membrane protein